MLATSDLVENDDVAPAVENRTEMVVTNNATIETGIADSTTHPSDELVTPR